MSRRIRLALGALALVSAAAAAQREAPPPENTMLEPIQYTLRFPDAAHHYVEVEAIVPTGGQVDVELAMAVWTPGSYLVREFQRQIEEIAAGGADSELAVEKTRKNRWRISNGGVALPDPVRVSYRLYAREMSVRTNFVDASFAILNGAPTFLTLAEDLERSVARPHDVAVELPNGWSRVVSPLPPAPGGGRLRAADFDTLVDSPLYAGSAAVYEFEVNGTPHLLVNEGEGGVWDGPRSAADVESIVRAQIDFWGVVPYDRYVFFNLLTETGGGLEHRDSTVMMSSRFRTRTRESYRGWLGLVSHEFFHTWNVKRLRPVELGPFDYEDEVYTESLWTAEGITSYYDELLLHRAGLIDRQEYLEALSKTIEQLQTTPGRLVQPLDRSSFDAWIKLYRRDENSINSGVSYYTKGAVVSFLLDAEIRRATGGERSLDDVLRRAWALYSGERGFSPEEFRAVVTEVAGRDLSAFFHHALETTEELDYQPALDWYGLRFAAPDSEEEEKSEKEESQSKNDEEEPAAWLGAKTELKDSRLVVTEVPRETPAHAAGVNVEDEILAIGEDRVPPTGWEERLKVYRPGEKVSLLVARRERLLRLPVTFGEEPEKVWKLEVDPEASEEQKTRLADWLGSAAEEVDEVDTVDAVQEPVGR